MGGITKQIKCLLLYPLELLVSNLLSDDIFKCIPPLRSLAKELLFFLQVSVEGSGAERVVAISGSFTVVRACHVQIR